MIVPLPFRSLWILLFLTSDDGIAFTSTLTQRVRRSSLYKKSGGIKSRAFMSEGNSENTQPDPHSTRTCIKNFLTQRSVQTFLFLLSQCRDPHTVKWIEDFGNTKNLLSYHGTAAMTEKFTHWDAFFNEMIEKPVDVVQVQAPNSGRPSGISANNPNREKEEQSRKPVIIEIDIDPPSLAGRILSVRELLGREWKEDLDLVRIATEKILSSYNQNVQDIRKGEFSLKNSDDDSKNATMYSYRKSTLDSIQTPDDKNYHDSSRQSFERTAIYMLNNHPAFDDIESSALRKSNFDLLFLLSTQEAVHRTLKTYMRKGDKEKTSFLWLRNFYTSRLEIYFDGNQRYGGSDDFLDDLLLSPPIVQSVSDGVPGGLVDPMLITEDIINARIQVASEWKSLLDSVPDDHRDLKRKIFVKQMNKWGQRIDTPSTSSVDAKKRIEVPEQVGEFE